MRAILADEGDDNRIQMSSREETTQPLTKPSVASAQRRQRCASALDQHLAQVFAATFGDAEQTRFASCRRLPRHEPEPRGKIATAREGLRVTDGRDESSCVERANPWNARQPARKFIPLRLRGEFGVECRDSLVQRPPRR